LNLPQLDWKGKPEGTRVTQAFINRLVRDNGYTQLVGKPTRGDSLEHGYIIGTEIALIPFGTVHGIGYHCGVLLEVGWIGIGDVTHENRLVPAYHKTNFIGLQNFFWDKLPTWANNGICVEDIWNNFKNIVFRVLKYLYSIKF
jgi:hypothetical protein